MLKVTHEENVLYVAGLRAQAHALRAEEKCLCGRGAIECAADAAGEASHQKRTQVSSREDDPYPQDDGWQGK